MITMKSKSPALARTARSVVPPSSGGLCQRLAALQELAQESDYVFGSSLGPFSDGANLHDLPHFIYIGPASSPDTLKLAILAGFGRHDLPATHALLAYVEGLTRRPDVGHGLNLSLFPLVNVLGLGGGAEDRDLTAANWVSSAEPEIRLLRQDSNLRGYQGFVRVVTTADDAPSAWFRSIPSLLAQSAGVEVFSPDDFHPWPVRFATALAGKVSSGPLSMAEDLPFSPFEIELALPAEWTQARMDQELAVLLKRLFTSYRAFQGYGQHL
jgi:hypothetical protein